MKLREWIKHVNTFSNPNNDQLSELVDKLDIEVATEDGTLSVLSAYLGDNGALVVDVEVSA